MSPFFYRFLFLLAYTNKFPFVSFTRNARLLHSARERMYRRHGLVEGNLDGLRIGLDVREGVDLLCWINRFERDLRAFLRTRVRPGATVIDAGAHIGVYSLLFSHWVGPTGRVEAFEPDPATADRLEANLKRNRLVNVHVHRCALGEAETRLPLNVTADPGFNSFGVPAGGSSVARRVPVPVTTLDLFCRREGIDHIDLLKMDIEGWEVPAFRGAGRLLREGRLGMAMVEYNREAQAGNGFDPRRLGELLRDAGFAPAVITRHGLKEFVNDGSQAYAELWCSRTPDPEV